MKGSFKMVSYLKIGITPIIIKVIKNQDPYFVKNVSMNTLYTAQVMSKKIVYYNVEE